MKIWRVEHETLINGITGAPRGPYSPCYIKDEALRSGLYDMCHAHSDGSKHRSPHEDLALGHRIEIWEICGLTSREALDAWFSEWHAALAAAGFVISVYEVPDDSVRVGVNGQCVFTYSAAARVGAEFWEVVA